MPELFVPKYRCRKCKGPLREVGAWILCDKCKLCTVRPGTAPLLVGGNGWRYRDGKVFVEVSRQESPLPPEV